VGEERNRGAVLSQEVPQYEAEVLECLMGLAVDLKRFKLDRVDAFDRNHGLKSAPVDTRIAAERTGTLDQPCNSSVEDKKRRHKPHGQLERPTVTFKGVEGQLGPATDEDVANGMRRDENSKSYWWSMMRLEGKLRSQIRSLNWKDMKLKHLHVLS
jgi:hypothetical protein